MCQKSFVCHHNIGLPDGFSYLLVFNFFIAQFQATEKSWPSDISESMMTLNLKP